MYITLQEKPRYALTITTSGKVLSSTYNRSRAEQFKDEVLDKVREYYSNPDYYPDGEVTVDFEQ